MNLELPGRPLDPMQVKDMVYYRLRDLIVDLSLAPGDPLRENTLSELFGVSKTPIREALVRLERDGLVEVAPYRGARVREYSSEEIREIFDARGILEAECVRRAAISRDESLLARLRANLEATADAIGSGDTSGVTQGLDDFDAILFELLDNELLTDVVDRLSLHLKRISALDVDPSAFEGSLAHHRLIVQGIEAGDPVAAVAHIREHIVQVQDRHVASEFVPQT